MIRDGAWLKRLPGNLCWRAVGLGTLDRRTCIQRKELRLNEQEKQEEKSSLFQQLSRWFLMDFPIFKRWQYNSILLKAGLQVFPAARKAAREDGLTFQ